MERTQAGSAFQGDVLCCGGSPLPASLLEARSAWASTTLLAPGGKLRVEVETGGVRRKPSRS